MPYPQGNQRTRDIRSSCEDVTTVAGPILLRLGRATNMAVFWTYFRDFVGAQKIEDLSKSKNLFAEVFQIKSRFVVAKKLLWVRCTLSLRKHQCKEVSDVKQGIDPYPLLARSCDRWWPDFVTFTASKRSIFGLKRGKKAQCVSNRCKDLLKKRFWGYGHFKLKETWK